MSGILEVQLNDYQIGPEKAVDFFSKIIWAEATRLGIGKNIISIPTAINVRDGGIDARIVLTSPTLNTPVGVIFNGYTCYQIKAGETFNPTRGSDIRSILFTAQGVLHPEVKTCLDQGGKLVVVAFGYNAPRPANLIEQYRAELVPVDSAYNRADIEVWCQDNIAGFLQSFPSLILDLKALSGEPFSVYSEWRRNGDMSRHLVKGSDYAQRVADLQSLLRSDQAERVRVNAEPGKGKTRFVFEAVSTEDLAPLVIYSDQAQKFAASSLLQTVVRDENLNVILVLDECTPQQEVSIWNRLQHLGNRIKLVTIYNDLEPSGEASISRVQVPNLSEEDMKRIILDYGVPADQVDRWAPLAGDSPRFAHMIGMNLRSHPDNILAPIENIYDRLIAGYEDLGSQTVRERRIVLELAALFKKFGYSGEVAGEGRIIAAKAQAQFGMSVGSFQTAIATLRQYRILQGENTLYISPKALHIRLWADWWNKYGSTFDHDAFMADIPASSPLREWFYEMFRYAAQSAVAIKVVQILLAPTGPLAGQDILREKVGADFFLAAAEADPAASVQYLQRTLGTWDLEQLRSFTTGRRQVIWALERIAVWKEHFHDAARLLLRLAEAENENYSNNASGVFAGLFSPGYGRLAPTEVAPLDRISILEETIRSESTTKQQLAISAADQALESDHFFRDVGAEFQGLKKMPNLWSPKSLQEITGYYSRVWMLLLQSIDSLNTAERDKAVDVLLNRTRSLGAVPDLTDMVFNTYIKFAKRTDLDKKKIIKTLVEVIHYHGKEMPAGIKRRWESLRDEMVGEGFTARMKRYVGMDLLEDKYDDKGNYVGEQTDQISRLAEEVIQKPKLLDQELPWLTTTDAVNGFSFGYQLGKRDKGFLLLPKLLTAQREATAQPSIYFLGGYFNAMHEGDSSRWEREFKCFAYDVELRTYTAELAWRSGLNDNTAQIIIGLLEAGIINASHINVFGLGRMINNLSQKAVEQWLNVLVNKGDTSSVLSALDQLDVYYLRSDPKKGLPKDLTLAILLHPALFQVSDRRQISTMADYLWKTVAEKYIEQYPESSLPIGRMMVRNLGADGSILDGYRTEAIGILNKVTQQHPQEIWKEITKELESDQSESRADVQQWLRGGRGFGGGVAGFVHLKPEWVWEWIDQDIDGRAWWVASFVPKSLFHSEENVCWARELLVRYGDREDVRRNLMANFGTESWTGPRSHHLGGKLEMLNSFRKDETDTKVLKWIDEYLQLTQDDIDRSRTSEERDEW